MLTQPVPIFIQKLAYQLRQPLPGQFAQAKMAPRTQVKARFKTQPHPEARRGSVLILLYKMDGEWFFPLIQRPEYDGHHSAQVGLPGGKQEPEDKDAVAAALRETEEEIGVPRTSITVLGSLTELYIPPSKFIVSPVVGWLHGTPMFVPDDFEVSEILPVAISELLQPEVIKQTNKPPGITHELATPYFALHDRVVWGATGMMLSEFSEVLRSTGPVNP